MERFLRRCLDSILAQTFTDYELLLVDDGSTDGSPAICDEYAGRDERVAAYHKPNGGLSDARNYGLARARGEYTIFFDPDDWVDPTGLDQLYAAAKEADADMAMCDIYLNDRYRQTYSRLSPSALDHMSVLHDLCTGRLQGYTPNKLIRLSVYRDLAIDYPKGIYGCEDQYAMCAMLKHPLCIAYVPIAFYHYVFYSTSSLSRYYDASTFEMDLRLRDMFVNLLADTPFKEDIYISKSKAIINRAFMYGQKQFNNEEFCHAFIPFAKYLSGYDVVTVLIRLALSGFYQQANAIARWLFALKQSYKAIRQSCLSF